MRLSVTAVLTCLVLGVTACGSGADDRADVAPTTAPTTAPPSPAPPVVSSTPPPSAATPEVSDLAAKAQAQAERQRRKEQRARKARRAERREQRRLERLNPLAGRPMGVYQGPQELAWGPYESASGADRETLATIALTPKATWMGSWFSDDTVYESVRNNIEIAQDGDPEALVQFAVFRMEPWEHEACDRLPSGAEQDSYRRWTDEFARAVGDAHTAIVLQPDGPFLQCVPGGSPVPADLISYAAKTFSALPNTSVYLDAGAGDWPSEGQGGVSAAVDFLMPAGIEHVRGVALNSTHYSSTEIEVRRGAALVDELARRGLPGKKVVINTSSNGHPFEFGDYTGPDPDNAYPCESPDDGRTCVSLGIPPTTEVDDPRWGLPDDVNRLARDHVDAYLWFGRPWLYRQNSPFEVDRALKIVRSSPWF
ncbi:glycoside hydrolase family 6 protein [Nocardioides sp. C4-1]|uniref:glycoside hydrolase family 6 protein n=1 Tax=Nocardioides sp. C4-1 TaxID=3151851 RepID=UPI0032665575